MYSQDIHNTEKIFCFGLETHLLMLLFTLRRAMSFTTRILKVRPESIQFVNDKPQISDNETLINLEIAAKELTTTHNAIGFPTETVYGLAGSALSDESVKSIYKAKTDRQITL